MCCEVLRRLLEAGADVRKAVADCPRRCGNRQVSNVYLCACVYIYICISIQAPPPPQKKKKKKKKDNTKQTRFTPQSAKTTGKCSWIFLRDGGGGGGLLTCLGHVSVSHKSCVLAHSPKPTKTSSSPPTKKRNTRRSSIPSSAFCLLGMLRNIPHALKSLKHQTKEHLPAMMVVFFPESIEKGSSGKVVAFCTAQLHRESRQ